MATYLEQLRAELAKYAGSAAAQPARSDFGTGAEGWNAYVSNMNRHTQRQANYQTAAKNWLASKVSAADASGRPPREKYVSFVNGNLQFNNSAWSHAMFDWMRGQDTYKTWSDQEIRDFAATSSNLSEGERSAQEFWTSSQQAWQQAGAEAKADRERMLAELETFKSGYNSQWINDTLSREKAYWDAKIATTLQNIDQQYAARGAVASPYVKAEIARRMVAQASDALQVRRYELENERAARQQYYLTTLNDVLGNTQRQVLDPLQAAELLQKLGSASSTVKAVKV